jgi:outer membrane protein assembly factor BamB
MDVDGGEDVAQAVATSGGTVIVAGTSSSIDGDPSDVSLVVRAYKAGSGKLLWEQAIEPPAGFLEMTVAFESPIAIESGRVFVAGKAVRSDSESDYAVWGFELGSGSVAWSDHVLDPGMADGASSLAVMAGRVFAGGTVGASSTVRAYDAATGALAWDDPVDEGGSVPYVAADAGRVVVASASCLAECDLAVRGYDAATGAPLFTRVLGRKGSQKAAGITMKAGDAIVASSDTRGDGPAQARTLVQAFKSTTGHMHWESSTDGASFGLATLSTRLFVAGWAAHTEDHHLDFAVRSFDMASE